MASATCPGNLHCCAASPEPGCRDRSGDAARPSRGSTPRPRANCANVRALIDIRPVSGRADFRRFIDYAYERNAGDPHWVPPLRHRRARAPTPKKNPFFAHADVELLLAWRGGRVVGRDRGDRRSAAPRDARRQRRDVRLLRGRRCRRRRARCSRPSKRWARGARPRARARTDQPVAQRERRAADRRLRHRPDADDAAQSAGVRRRTSRRPATRRSRTCSPGCTSCEREPPPVFVKLADAAARQARHHRPAAEPRASSRARSSACAPSTASAWERNWGFVPPTDAEFRRLATELKPIFDPRCAVCAEVDGRPVGVRWSRCPTSTRR